MNEELIRQCARGGYAELCRKEGWPSLADAATRGEEDDADEVVCAIAAIRLYDARAVAPLERENAELRALVAELTEQTKRDGDRIGQLEAKVAPLVAAATEARRIAMEQAVKARVPECGNFGEIAQDLDAALAPFQQEACNAAD